MSSKNPVPLRDIIDTLLSSCRKETGGDLDLILSRWEDAVGKMISANTRPAALKGAVLLVHANSPVWIHELQFMKGEIVSGINAALGKPLIRDIRFKIGRL